MHIGFFASFHGTSLEHSKSHCYIFQVSVVMKPFVSCVGRLIACSARISIDRHKQTDRETDTHTNYCNPRLRRMCSLEKGSM